VNVTVENQGNMDASGYDVVLIPTYGAGPPNPVGPEALPVMVPGASESVFFSPGVLYSTAGTFTLRVLVSDDWYEEGNPDSTGTAGDFEDTFIAVYEPTPVPTPTNTPTPIGGKIGGFVWRDDNGDGVLQKTETVRLSGVTINLKTGSCGTIGKPLPSVITDGKGNYVFTNKGKGTYCVSIQPPPYIIPPTVRPTSYTVVLGAGDELFGYNFGVEPGK
jgi:hypothetical protein